MNDNVWCRIHNDEFDVQKSHRFSSKNRKYSCAIYLLGVRYITCLKGIILNNFAS